MARRPSAAASKSPSVSAILADLKRRGEARIARQMQERFGITGRTAETAYGMAVGDLRTMAKELRGRGRKPADAARNHALAAALWETGQYEARMLACFVDEPTMVTPAQMNQWAKDFDNWGICDTACFCLFDRVEPVVAFARVRAWAKSKDEFVKRGAFALLASMALHRKEMPDDDFVSALPLIEAGAADDRNFVKKGVSWALRGIGKRKGTAARTAAAAWAARMAESAVASVRWVGRDALRDFQK